MFTNNPLFTATMTAVPTHQCSPIEYINTYNDNNTEVNLDYGGRVSYFYNYIGIEY